MKNLSSPEKAAHVSSFSFFWKNIAYNSCSVIIWSGKITKDIIMMDKYINMTKIKKTALSIFTTALVLSSVISNTQAANTSHIPSKPTSAIVVQDNETYDFRGRTLDGSKITNDGLFRCFGRRGVTIKNVTVTNNPRYAFLGRGCSGLTIENFEMKNMSKSKGGIRLDKGTSNKTVIIKNITANNIGGHAVELWDTNGFTIGKITAKNTKGCGLLLNRSRNGTVESVIGDKNDQKGGYATFRVANNNGPNVKVKEVKSRNSGRGFFSVSGSNGTTVKYVDIAGSNGEGIYIQDSSSTKVLSGKSRGRTNCRIRGGSSNSIKADCGGKIAH